MEAKTQEFKNKSKAITNAGRAHSNKLCIHLFANEALLTRICSLSNEFGQSSAMKLVVKLAGRRNTSCSSEH